MATPRQIKVFIASPGDLAVERRAFKDTCDALNKGFGRGADVEFVPLGWEDALSTVGRRPQSVINKEVDACDVFILVLFRRWGQAAPDAKPYSSYTEEEFHRALARFEKTGSPCMHAFFKEVESGVMADPGKDLKKVLAFRKKLAKSGKVLYRMFADEKSFAGEIDRHLTAFAKGETSVAPTREAPIIPDSLQAEIDQLKKDRDKAVARVKQMQAQLKKQEKKKPKSAAQSQTKIRGVKESKAKLAAAKAEAQALTLAESASKAALEGKIEEARQNFAKALDGTTNPRVLYLGYEFFKRIGELDEAERLVQRRLAISGRDQLNAGTVNAVINLGRIAQDRGDLDAAEKLHREALEMSDMLGRPQEQAASLGNLGVVAQTRGDLEAAEKLYRESLEKFRKLGEQLGQAACLGNLGAIAQNRGDLAVAEKLHREAMEIHEKLGRVEEQAANLGNLGLVAEKRGDLAEARQRWTEARDLFARLGMSQDVKRYQGFIDGIRT